jgi:glycine/D-amino acid oxidase-like deaminating enzyme
MRAYQLVSKPLGEHARTSILPEGQPLTDTRRLFSGVRRHADGRIHVSADGPVFDMNGEPNVKKVNRRMATIFPHLGPLEWEHQWAGWVGMTYDLNPHLHELAPGLWAALGYSGRGIAMATMMGRDLATRIAGASDTAAGLPARALAAKPNQADREAPRRLPAQLLPRARRARR